MSFFSGVGKRSFFVRDFLKLGIVLVEVELKIEI